MRVRIFLLLLFVASATVRAADTTVIYGGATTTITRRLPDEHNLWLALPDLTRATRFVLKPQGACLDEFCMPIPKAREKDFVRQQQGQKWFNVSELARALHQPEVHNAQYSVWLYGPRPEAQMKYLESLEAPNFTLPDWKGTPRSLSDFRGKKVLLLTWASW